MSKEIFLNKSGKKDEDGRQVGSPQILKIQFIEYFHIFKNVIAVKN